jgi:tetratricopeptide (TPR) repeat protein
VRTLPLAAVWLLAFAVRVLYLWQIADAPFFGLRLGDAEAYHEWARRIAAGDWPGSGVFYQAPLYPYCLALIYSTVGESVAIVRLFQAMLGATSCALLGAAGIALFGRAGLAAGLALAIYPSAIFYDGLLDKTSLMAFLVTALLWLLVMRGGASARRRWLRWFGAGAVLGLLALTRENALILALPILVFALVTTVRAHAACFLIGLLIVLIPVGIRNLSRGGEFQLTTAQLGPNLYIGNRAGASGTYEPLVVGHGSAADEREDATRLAQQALGHPPTPREVSRYWTARALTAILDHPGRALRLFARKVAMTFGATEIADTETQDVYTEWSGLLRLLSVFDFGVLLGLAAFGLVMSAGEWRRLWIVCALVATYALSVAAFYVLGRYRFPLVPMLILMAAGGVAHFGRVASAASRILPPEAGSHASLGRQALLAVAAGVIAVLFAHVPLADERGTHAAHYAGIATALARDPVRTREARQFYERALAAVPGHPATEFAFATFLSQLGRQTEAIPHYRAALAAWPDHAEAHFNLGVALSSESRIDEAAQHFGESIRLRPDDADAHLALARALVALDRARDAISHYEHALAINPNEAAVHNDLGTTLANEGRVREALLHFERAVALDPGNERARQNVAMARRMLQ